ncbi:MAG TPA: carboxypeptidase-like regulatory domain-containing protein [Pyrinomonadaceae bacterium]|jgi:hypothetical protein|nr:carboxypeptidase-like regulatory domain-containing protein [Pyrinomonadaceae bacterium]
MKLLRSKTVIPFASVLLLGSIFTSSRAQDAPNVAGVVSVTVVGVIGDQASAVVPGAHVSLYSLDRILQTTSDSSGHFEFKAVAPGTYEFEVFAPGFKRFSKTIVVDRARAATGEKAVNQTATMQIAAADSARNIIPVDLALAVVGPCLPDRAVYAPRSINGNAVAGVVVEYPKVRVTRATVQLFDAKGAHIAQQQTDERGEFQFKEIAPGHYYVTLQHPAYNEMKSSEFWVARDNTTNVTLDPVPLGKIRVCQ